MHLEHTTRVLLAAHLRDPLQSYSVTNLHMSVAVFPDRNNSTDAFVPAYDWHGRLPRPVAVTRVDVRVADAAVLHFDEAFSWGELMGLLYWVIIPQRQWG